VCFPSTTPPCDGTICHTFSIQISKSVWSLDERKREEEERNVPISNIKVAALQLNLGEKGDGKRMKTSA
jgi:hypothetical protein